MSQSSENVVRLIAGKNSLSAPAELDATKNAIQDMGGDDVRDVLSALAEVAPPEPNGPGEQLLELVFRQLQLCAQREKLGEDTELLASAAVLYRHLGPECRPRRYLLATLAISGKGASLQEFAKLLAVDPPPLESLDAAAAIAPLFQRLDYDPSDLFPNLLDALAHPQVASAVLDLANFVLRTKRTQVHPAASEVQRLIVLLKGVCARLQQLENEVITNASQLNKSQRRISDSVAIASSLCDALGLVGDSQATTALHDALALTHRRVRVEAAAALARLGDDDGAQALVQLAEYPVVRLRAVAYAEELGLLDHLDDQWNTPAAIAEAELACYLADPNQLGAGPTAMELIDEQTMAWPSFDQPQTCYLFRFTYELGNASYTNIGIAGPLEHTFQVDLTSLSNDDLYAIFAGWQAEHPDIVQIPVENFNDAHLTIADKITAKVAGEGMKIETLVALGVFFGEAAIVAAARRGDTVGALVASGDEAAWFPHDGHSPRPLGPEEAWCIWKGRRLLAAFNP